jgi:hypothetical protein
MAIEIAIKKGHVGACCAHTHSFFFFLSLRGSGRLVLVLVVVVVVSFCLFCVRMSWFILYT